MNKQTYDYIYLKAISDRVKEVSKSFSNEEIERIIRSEIKEQIREQIDFTDLGNYISEIIESWTEEEENIDFVMDTIKKSIIDRMSK